MPRGSYLGAKRDVIPDLHKREPFGALLHLSRRNAIAVESQYVRFRRLTTCSANTRSWHEEHGFVLSPQRSGSVKMAEDTVGARLIKQSIQAVVKLRAGRISAQAR